MVIGQGDVWWADLPEPTGSGPGFRRPIVVVQSDDLNRSRLATVVCAPLTSNLKYADAPGNVYLTARGRTLHETEILADTNSSNIESGEASALAHTSGYLFAKPYSRRFYKVLRNPIRDLPHGRVRLALRYFLRHP